MVILIHWREHIIGRFSARLPMVKTNGHQIVNNTPRSCQNFSVWHSKSSTLYGHPRWLWRGRSKICILCQIIYQLAWDRVSCFFNFCYRVYVTLFMLEEISYQSAICPWHIAGFFHLNQFIYEFLQYPMQGLNSKVNTMNSCIIIVEKSWKMKVKNRIYLWSETDFMHLWQCNNTKPLHK